MKMRKKAVAAALCLLCCVLPGRAEAAPFEEEPAGVMVLSLPEAGTLLWGERTLGPGDAVPAERLSELRWTGEAGTVVCLPVYRDGRAGEETALRAAALTGRPAAAELELVTYRNLSVRGVFPVRSGGAAYECRILTRPSQGTVTAENGSFVYTPYQNRTGTDRFTYVVRDAGGAWSGEAEVRVRVTEQPSDVVYGDVDGRGSAFAAVRLAEAGVYAGPVIGGVRYFSPEETVTRGEFIAMTLAAAGRQPAAADAAGEECVPAWSGGYVAAAMASGVVSGRDGGTPDTGEPVTLSEAAVILAGAGELRGEARRLHGESVVPDWAADAVARLEAEGSLDPAWVESAGGGHLLTRAEAALLLLPRLTAREQAAAPVGLFSWTTRD